MERRAAAAKLDKLAALKAARAGGKGKSSRLAEWKPAEDAELYDEVSEDQYKEIVGNRLQRDDFIEDDGIGGYQDNGMDVWEGGRGDESDEEEEDDVPRARKSKPATAKAPKRAQPVARPAPPSAYRPAISAGKEDDFMASLLSSVAATPSAAPSSGRSRPSLGSIRKRKSSPDYGSMPSSEGYEIPSSDGLDVKPAMPSSSDGPEEGEDAGMWGYRSKKPRTSGASIATVKAEPVDPPSIASGRRGVSFAQDDKENVDVDGDAHGAASDDDDDEFAVRGDKAAHAAPKAKLFAINGGNKVKAEPTDPGAAKSRRTMVNSSSISAKAAAAAALAQKTAEDTAREVAAQASDDAKATASGHTAGKPGTKSWLSIQEGLNVGQGPAESATTAAEDEDDLYNASVKLKAAKKGKTVPGLNPAHAIDAFEPAETKAGEMQVEGDEQERTLRMYWLDYMEGDRGVVHLVGKVLDRATGRYVSACVSIDGIQRNLFVLPRPTRVENGHDTGMNVSVMDIYQELDAFRRLHEVDGRLAMKAVKRKYAFEVQDVPQGEHEWYKVVYGFDQPRLPMNSSGATFSKIFGTNTSAFEMLVIKRKIKGPCWVEIKGCTRASGKAISWCKLEVRTSNPKNVSPFSETDSSAPRDTPPLTVMSLSARTIVNHAQNTQEILAMTASVWENYNIDDTTPIEKLRHASHTVVRPLGAKFPPRFEMASKKERQPIQTVADEKILLNSVLGIISRNDPDLIVGHGFLEGTLETFLQRVKALRADLFSRIGRFKKTQLKIFGKGYQNMRYLAGRLLADLDTDGSRSMIDSVSWSMTEMCRTQLGFEREDIDPDTTADYFDAFGSSPDKLLHFVRHLQMDAFFQMAIAAKVQLLPLTQQLTTLAGNSWNRTLTGARAERNEYILLHEFHRLKYICPDKGEGKASSRQPKTQKFDEDGTLIPQVKRLKYQGGLVFEPKRGLWDTFVMVMDFNSLYPSIIQEYNIDFTTVERHDDEEAVEEIMPEVPGKDVPQGVLPRLIATLVARRREVKGNMKAKNATAAQLQQWDIRQKALKLTANSMYGCLGFDGSRFYARPLAALTTFKGREILTATKELAEGMSLDVVYGDTDSVFVNSNVTDYGGALKIANEFKRAVNERYRLLEIDLDAVFSRVLLLQKKKYAAMKISEDGHAKLEIKGLDMVRREFCKLSKGASEFVLGKIMSGAATEQVVSDVHDYLTTLGENLRSGKIDLDDLIINKRLGKNPEDYPDKKGQPHVQVALRLKAKGGSGKAGDVIPYVFCLGADGKTSKSAQADRAFHPDEFRRKDSGLKIDNDFYLSNQVLTVIERLCEDIEGTDRARLAECLGLDPSKFQNTSVAGVVEKDFVTFASQLSDKDRFREAAPLAVRCRACKAETLFQPLLEDQEQLQLIRNEGVICPCGARIAPASISVQVEHAIRAHISRYYLGLYACSECREKSRSVSVYGHRCVSTAHCRGEMKPDYPDSKLENQLLYFASLFDVDKAVEAVSGTSRAEEVNALAMHNRPAFEDIKAMVTSYLNKDGRRWVNMGQLFSFATAPSRSALIM